MHTVSDGGCMPKRSKVSVYEQIRKAHEREGLGIRALARRFGVHRRDVRQALVSALPPPRKPPPPRPAPMLDSWKPIIERWLEEDKKAPRKQRHTARRVWQRLVEEHGADVGESTVRRYVAEVRARQDFPLAEVAVPQHHPLGAESEVDFGAASVYLAGVSTEVHLFLMRLSASGRAYIHAYLNEAQEVFLDGHVRAFEHFGGVPDRIRYDNLKAAVERCCGAGTAESPSASSPCAPLRLRQLLLPARSQGRPRKGRRRGRGRPVPPPPPGPAAHG